MKPKDKPSRMASGKKVAPQKTLPPNKPLGADISLLKKNEFTLIIVGALVVTVLVFFLFFSGGTDAPKAPQMDSKAPATDGGQVNRAIEERVSDLELALNRLAAQVPPEGAAGGNSAKQAGEIRSLNQRLDRLETALTLKTDSLIQRLNKMERRVAEMKQAPVPPTPKVTAAPEKKMKPLTDDTPVVKKKAVQQPKKKALFHTVKKGETLWSISQRYKTTVVAIRKLNNLSVNDKIYPGANLLVR